MTLISRHETLGVDFARNQLVAIEPTIAKVLEGGRSNPWYLQRISSVVEMLVSYRLVIDPASTDPRISGQVALIAEANDAIFACAAAEKDAVVETSVGEPLTLWGTGPFEYANPADWLYAFSYAVVARRANIVDRLCRSRPVGATDEYVVLWGDALRQYWHTAGQPFLSDRVFDAIEAAMDATSKDRVEVTSARQIELVERPLLSALSKLVLADGGPGASVDAAQAAAFNSALAEALEGHKKFWGAESRKHQSLQFIAWNALAMACLATDFGIEVTVESDYLPLTLLRPPTQSAAAYYWSVVDPNGANHERDRHEHPAPIARLSRPTMTPETLDALGVAVAQDAINTRFGVNGAVVRPLALAAEGPDNFAGIWQVSGATGSARIVVAEGLGPNFVLRNGPVAPQGTRPYLDAMLNAVTNQTAVAAARSALAEAALDYVLVTPALNADGALVGTTTRDFAL